MASICSFAEDKYVINKRHGLGYSVKVTDMI
jgi:hypothetical protein